MFNAGSIFARLGLDSSEFTANIKGSKASLDSFATATDEKLSNVAGSTNSLSGSVNNMASGMKQASGSAESLGSSLKSLARKIASLYIIKEAVSAVKDFASYAFKGAVNLEQVSIAFTTMLGSADIAKQSLEELAAFAKKTPFELPQVQEGATKLLAYGVTAKDLIPTLQMVGDVAAGVGMDKFEPLIRAFGQVSAKGRLMGTELLQISETGFNVAEAMGVTRASLEAMVSAGQVSFGELKHAFINATSNGGKFFGLMENQSKSAGGMISNLKDSFGQLATAIAGVDKDGTMRPGGLLDRAKGFLQNLLDAINPNIDAMIAFGDAVVDVVQAALEPFLGKLNDINAADLKGTLEDWTAQMKNFSIGVGIAANVVNLLFQTIKEGVFVLVGAGKMMHAFLVVVNAVFMDATNAASNFIQRGIGGVGTSLNKLVHRDFSGAGSAISGIFTGMAYSSAYADSAMNSLSSTWDATQVSLIGGANDVVGAFDGLSTAISLAFLQASPDIIEPTKDALDGLGGSAIDAGDAINDATGKIKDSKDAKTSINSLKDALNLLKNKAGEVFDTFKKRRTDVKDAMEAMHTSVKKLRLEISKIKDAAHNAINGKGGLRDLFSQDLSDLKTGLGDNVAKELLGLEDTISSNAAKIIEINGDTATKVASINSDLYDDETKAQTKYAADSVAIEEDRLADIAKINEKRDYSEFEKDAAEEVARIKHSISDYSTQAERDEAEERYAIIEQEKQDKINKLNEELDAEIASVTTAAEKQQTTLQAALEKELTDARTKAAEAIAIYQQESTDKVAILQKEIDDSNAIIVAHQSTFQRFAANIVAARTTAAQDSIAVLLSQFQVEKTALKTKLAEDIQTEKGAKNQAIKDAKDAFAEEMDVNVKNLDNLKEFWKHKENRYQDHLDTIASKRKKALNKLDEEFTAAFEVFDSKTGGALSKTAGGTDIEISKSKSGAATITIENMNVSNSSDIDTLVSRLSNLLNVATA